MRPQFVSIRYDLSLFFPFVAICIICHLAYDTHFSLFFTICSEYNYIHSQGSLWQSKMKNEIFDTFSRHIWTRPSPPAGCGTLVDCPIKIILSILSEIAPRPMVKVTIHCCKREKKIVKTIRQCLYGISINVFTLIIALLTGKKLNDDFFQFGALISQTWNFSNFNAVRVIKLGINCDRAHFFFGGGGRG